MVSTYIEQPQDWLWKSERDLNGAKSLYRSTYYDLSVYHCQQCVEKALKGYLCHKGHQILKTHDLGILIKACITYDIDFRNIEIECLSVDQLDVRFRYPTAQFEPPEAATLEAIENAETVLDFVKNKII
jgi:HEPN domain-containing protein